MIEIDDILISGFDKRRVIDVQDDYVIALLFENINGSVNQDGDNIGEFILRNDIADDFTGQKPQIESRHTLPLD